MTSLSKTCIHLKILRTVLHGLLKMWQGLLCKKVVCFNVVSSDHYNISTLTIEISFEGLSNSSTLTFSIAAHTSMPLVTLPKTVCLLSNQGVGTVVMKNCEPFVPGPAFAMETVNGLSCRKLHKQ